MAKKAEMPEAEAVVETKLSPIVDDFGREDLNRLRDVVNALVERA